jgi:hypothetical protein
LSSGVRQWRTRRTGIEHGDHSRSLGAGARGLRDRFQGSVVSAQPIDISSEAAERHTLHLAVYRIVIGTDEINAKSTRLALERDHAFARADPHKS